MGQAVLTPTQVTHPGEIVINPWSLQSLGASLFTIAANPAAAAWPSAGTVLFVPFWIAETMTVTKLWWGVGAAAGNLDAGVYDESAVLRVSAGSTAAAGTNTAQVVDVTDTALPRGRYYMALVADTVTTLTISKVAPVAGICQSLGMLQQASVTLPLSTGASPATFAICTTAYVPYFGVQGYRAVGP